MSDESTSVPGRTSPKFGLFTPRTPAWRATDPDPIGPDSADYPLKPAPASLRDGESSYPWPSWRPDEEFGQGDDGFGEDS